MHAILDGARSPLIYESLLKGAVEATCLYRGELSPPLAAAAPYLVKLDRHASFTDRLIRDGWGKSWGIFLSASTALPVLRRHFRKFLIVYDENAKSLYFRYYDPRVLRTYLPTCNAAELKQVFGPVEWYMTETEDGSGVLRFMLGEGAVARSETAFA
jgi:hypothetical protein